MAENEARRETDELLRELEREINREYRQAEEELRAKLRQYLADYERKDRIKREQVKRGIITEDEYVRWRMGQLAIGQRWQEQIAVITQDMRNAGEIAHSITEGYMPSVYALNHNYATYEAEKGAMVDTSYTLYSREAVERMMREDPELLPAPGRRVNSLIAQGKANRWDRKVVQSSMVQGILQGESIPNIATRISRDLGETNRKAALRYARTMTTGAENAGHVDAYERAQSKGIEIRQMWLATLDGRTRDSHREMDGETVEVGGTFSNGCKFPGDPSGPAEEVWNCRCRVISQIKGFEIDPTDPTVRRSDKLDGMTYEEWREAHGVSEPIEKPDEIARRMRYAYGAEYRKGMKGEEAGEEGPNIAELFKTNAELLNENGDIDLTEAEKDYKEFLTNVPARNRIHLEEANKKYKVVETNDTEVSMGFKRANREVLFNGKNLVKEGINYAVGKTHELAHGIDLDYVRSWKNEAFTAAIANMEKVISEDPQKFLKYTEENNGNGFLGDLLSAGCRGQYKFTTGHPEEYWKRNNTRAFEAFANLYSMESFSESENIKFVAENFPDVLKAYRNLRYYKRGK